MKDGPTAAGVLQEARRELQRLREENKRLLEENSRLGLELFNQRAAVEIEHLEELRRLRDENSGRES
jgi:regulator of replication initiation timing